MASNTFMRVDDVAKELDVSKSYAYIERSMRMFYTYREAKPFTAVFISRGNSMINKEMNAVAAVNT